MKLEVIAAKKADLLGPLLKVIQKYYPDYTGQGGLSKQLGDTALFSTVDEKGNTFIMVSPFGTQYKVKIGHTDDTGKHQYSIMFDSNDAEDTLNLAIKKHQRMLNAFNRVIGQ